MITYSTQHGQVRETIEYLNARDIARESALATYNVIDGAARRGIARLARR